MREADWKKADAACHAKPAKDYKRFWYREAIKSARMATTHESRVTALRSADRFRRYIIGGITRNDYDYVPIMASGHPAWPIRKDIHAARAAQQEIAA